MSLTVQKSAAGWKLCQVQQQSPFFASLESSQLTSFFAFIFQRLGIVVRSRCCRPCMVSTIATHIFCIHLSMGHGLANCYHIFCHYLSDMGYVYTISTTSFATSLVFYGIHSSGPHWHVHHSHMFYCGNSQLGCYGDWFFGFPKNL